MQEVPQQAELGSAEGFVLICLTLPLAPTINHYYCQSGKRKYISKDGQKFRAQVAEIVSAAGHPTLEGRVALFASVYPKNRIRQDVDNRAKPLQDALTHAGVWLDDSQVDLLVLARQQVVKGGQMKVIIMELGND